MTKLPFIGLSKNNQIQLSVDLLRENGYIVIEPLEETSGIKKISDLVRLFYMLLYKKIGSNVSILPSPNKRDLTYAKELVNSRIKLGMNKARALEESAKMIRCFFSNFDKFYFKEPVSSMSVFGQDTMGWVSEKILSFQLENDREESILSEAKSFSDRHLKQYVQDLRNICPERKK